MNKAENLLQEAQRLFNSNKLEQALEKAQESYDLRPSIRSIFFLQVLLNRLKKYDDSIEIYKQGLLLIENSKDPGILSFEYKLKINLAKSYKSKFDLQNAAEILNNILCDTNRTADQIESVKSYLKQVEEIANWTADYRAYKEFIDNYVPSVGEKNYILEAQGFKVWEEFHQGKSTTWPGNIENKLILENIDIDQIYEIGEKEYSRVILKDNLIENKDFVIVPSKIYESTIKNAVTVDQEIIRYNILVSDDRDEVQVELYLQQFLIAFIPSFKGLQQKYICTSRKTLIYDLKSHVHEQVSEVVTRSDVDPNELRVWKFPKSVNPFLINEKQPRVIVPEAKILSDSDPIEYCEILPDDFLVFEYRKKNGIWTILTKSIETCTNCHRPDKNLRPCARCKTTKYCSEACERSHSKFHKGNCKTFEVESKSRGRNGLVGLQNLGNTCFMNSALQCLSHTVPLTTYFLQGLYHQDLNPNNPLGTKGAILAIVYAELLEEMWKGTSAVVSPWNFKKVLSKFATQFSGYQQHDSHELLSYLLTGLHEDLNKVVSKKYMETPDLTDRSDFEAAKIQWELFLMRNRSAIVDFMYGQNKSTLVCPNCNRVSITFDPFLTLSLTVPNYDVITFQVLLVFQDLSKEHIKLKIEVEACCKLSKIKETLQKKYGIKLLPYRQEKLLFKNICSDEVIVENLSKNIVIFYEVPENLDNMAVIGINVSKAGEKGYFFDSKKEFVSFPRVIFIDNNSPTIEAAKAIMKIFSSVFSKFGAKVPENIEDFQNCSIAAIKNCNKTLGICNFCKKKCDGCNFIISDSATISNILALLNSPDETLNLEIEFHYKLKKIQANNEIKVENSININEKTYIDLYSCLKNSSEPEKLDENNKWYCNKCKSHVCATKQLKIYKLPNIFIVHLLRFKKKNGSAEKINTFIDFPLESFRVNSISEENIDYDLYAVSNHFGGTAGGHYTAYIKSHSSENWFEMDDSHVTQISKDQVVTNAGYILFYKRKNIL